MWTKANEAVRAGDLQSLRAAIGGISSTGRTPEKLGSLLLHVPIPWTALLPSMYAESIAIAEYLVSAGADINYRNDAGDTLLYYLTYHNTCGGDTEGEEPVNLPYSDEMVYPLEVHRQFLDLVKAVVTAGANLNLLYQRDRKSVTMLWMAASRPDRSVVALLLDHGADPGIGESALELAIKMESIEIVELLSGANR